MSDWYRLEGRTPVPCDVRWWTNERWRDHDLRRVARTEINADVHVSTVFLPLDHRYGDGPPELFETMVFGGPLDQECERYSTYDEAEQGHARMCLRARVGAVPAEGLNKGS